MKKAVLSAAAALVLSAASAFAQNANPPAAPGWETKLSIHPTQTIPTSRFLEQIVSPKVRRNLGSNPVGTLEVSDLKKDDDGVWRGKATKDGKSVDVSLDFQGNVTAR